MMTHLRSAPATLGTVLLLALASTPSAAQEYYTAGSWDVGNGYRLENWLSDNFQWGWAGTAIYSSTNFQIKWDISQYGFLHRVGKYYIYKKVDDVGPNASAYHDHYLESWRSGSDAYTGLYGWLWDPQIEWYIVEDWMTTKPSPGGTYKGVVYLNGGAYDLYNVQGGSYGNWQQWWSIRREKCKNGNISYMNHIKKWRQLGMANATISNVAFFLEPGYGISTKGKVDYYNMWIGTP